MQAAMKQLGYHDVYHFKSMVFENPRDSEMWLDALNAKYYGRGKPFGKAEWDQLLGHCEAITDTPCLVFWRELLEAYPDAKVVLAVRNADALLRSYTNTLTHVSNKFCAPTWNPYTLLYRLMMPETLTGRTIYLQFKHFYGFDFAENGKQRYLDYNQAVREATKDRDFLEFDVRQGWGPLCQFLGKDIPSTPFPRSNDTGTFFDQWEPFLRDLNGLAAMRMQVFECAVVAALALAIFSWLRPMALNN